MDVRDVTKPQNGARNQLGRKYYDIVATVANPDGAYVAYRYVRYNSTANAAVQATPACVWWTDATFTTVTSTLSEGMGVNFAAGLLMINSTDVSTLTAAILNGNFVWICVAGYVKSVAAAASTVKGDLNIGNQTDWTTTAGLARLAAGANITYRPLAAAVTSLSSSKADLLVVIES